jgi:hypothetical protein
MKNVALNMNYFAAKINRIGHARNTLSRRRFVSFETEYFMHSGQTKTFRVREKDGDVPGFMNSSQRGCWLIRHVSLHTNTSVMPVLDSVNSGLSCGVPYEENSCIGVDGGMSWKRIKWLHRRSWR